MIQDVGNIELCELHETEPKTKCTAGLSYWDIGIVYCTCGHFLQKETGVDRKFVKFFDGPFAVLEYVIKKGRLKIIETKNFCRRWDALADEDHTLDSTRMVSL